MKKVMLLAPKDLCDILQQALETTYITLPSYDPSTCTELLRHCPDVLILSLSLPGTDGLTFLKKNRENLPSHILVLTAFVDMRILSELSRVNVDDVLLMPVSLAGLYQSIDHVLGKKHPS